jgi:hypothetical protein
MILAANCPYAGSEVLRSSGFISDPNGGPDPVCTDFPSVVDQISGNSQFANLLPYEVVNTGVQGTVVNYHGEYQTNNVSTNGSVITTKYQGAAWLFKHN